jgi:rsbT co-antagonist protein RsbR
LLSFDPSVVQRVIEVILPVVERYRPDRAIELAEAVATFPSCPPNGRYITEICSRIVAHLERRYNQQRTVAQELEQARLYEHRLERVLAELATPVIPILEEVIVLPLIGAIDTRRAQLIMENLLQGIADFQATVAIIDITGVPVVDTAVADTLMRAVKAASLLGARVILSGISARIALTLVSLGLDMSHVLTCGQLRDSIMTALELRGLRIVPLANC